MRAKQIGLYVTLLALAVVSGLAVQKFCYRYPTEQEMKDYHRGHFDTTLEKLESQVLQKKDGTERIVFKGLHLPSGKEEIYYVEAGKRWVMPWADYNWKTEKPEEEGK